MLVIFDLDGTLLDTVGDIGGAADNVLGFHGFPKHSAEEYMAMMGHGMRNFMKKALPDSGSGFSEEEIDGLLRELVDNYLEIIDLHTKPYDGIHQLLRDLQKRCVKIAVASNKIQSGVETLMSRFFPDIDFVMMLGQRVGHPLKPDPEIVRMISAKVTLECGAGIAEDTVMVGDSPTDIATARNAGIRCIAVSWGYRPVESLAGADYIAHSPQDILKFLCA